MHDVTLSRGQRLLASVRSNNELQEETNKQGNPCTKTLSVGDSDRMCGRGQLTQIDTQNDSSDSIFIEDNHLEAFSSIEHQPREPTRSFRHGDILHLFSSSSNESDDDVFTISHTPPVHDQRSSRKFLPHSHNRSKKSKLYFTSNAKQKVAPANNPSQSSNLIVESDTESDSDRGGCAQESYHGDRTIEDWQATTSVPLERRVSATIISEDVEYDSDGLPLSPLHHHGLCFITYK